MLSKQNININFAQGLDLKNDPWQLSVGSFLSLKNSVFTTGKRLTKRNGYSSLPSLPLEASFVTTFNDDLTAIGSTIQAYSTSNKTWVSKGQIEPLTLSTLPLIRNNLNQVQADAVISSNGLVCTVYTELNNTTKAYKYAIADAVTGQNIISPTIISSDPTYGTPKVYFLGAYFIIIYTVVVSTVPHLVYIAIPISNPSNPIAQTTISTSYTPSTTVSFDAFSFNNNLYIAWDGASTTGIKMAYIGATSPGSASPISAVFNVDTAHSATLMSVTADAAHSIIWVSYYNSATSTGYSLALNTSLQKLSGYPVQIIVSGTILNITSAAQGGLCSVFYEVSNAADGIQTNYIASVVVTQAGGAVSSPVVVLRSVGLASKACIIEGVIYFLCAYSSTYQPTYFLVNGSLSTSANPVIAAKLAYENAGGYLTTGLPSALVNGSSVSIAYLYKDLIEALANSNTSGTTVTGGVYSQTGINMVTFQLGSQGLLGTEIGSNLNISGGYLIAYDGYTLAEQGFHLWPDSCQATTTSTGGFLAAQIYFGVFTYEWTDNQGNAFRSAGSIPVQVDLSASMTATNKITWTIPTLRLTQKISNPVKIVGYRWSTAQQVYYQFTSIIAPILNDTTVDTVTIQDTLADASIQGNNILYTTGSVVEDIGGPATSLMTLFDDRLWLVDSEDQNLLWYSKQVIESTPVEMSDLFTVYVAPSLGSTGPTGPITSLFGMDDKIIIFKRNAINYINGTGPDNTGSNSQYSQPTFITSMIGCSNQNSIVFQPNGLMFEYASDAGNQIWMLSRDLGSQYIGAPVEAIMKNATVLSAIAVPGTNQVRFNLDSGITLMYDYFYQQWGTFSNNSLSSTLFQDLHTYISPFGEVFQESPGVYLDGSTPVLLSFVTSWLNLAGVQGYERFYDFTLLCQYISPHFLNVQLAYDYEPYPSQQSIIQPNNYTGNYGSDLLYGQTTPYGGPGNREQWRVHARRQTCQSFQISLIEIFNPFFGSVPGAGFYLSGLDCTVGIKKGRRPIAASNSI